MHDWSIRLAVPNFRHVKHFVFRLWYDSSRRGWHSSYFHLGRSHETIALDNQRFHHRSDSPTLRHFAPSIRTPCTNSMTSLAESWCHWRRMTFTATRWRGLPGTTARGVRNVNLGAWPVGEMRVCCREGLFAENQSKLLETVATSWSLSLLAATVWSFVHLPLGLSDRNKTFPVSSEISDHFLRGSYFVSQSKEINFGDEFFDACCENKNFRLDVRNVHNKRQFWNI